MKTTGPSGAWPKPEGGPSSPGLCVTSRHHRRCHLQAGLMGGGAGGNRYASEGVRGDRAIAALMLLVEEGRSPLQPI